MSWWRQQLGACLDSVATQLPHLQSSLSQLGHSVGEWVGSIGGGSGSAGVSEVGQEHELGGRRLRVVRQLGEGGYSFVYLVREMQSDSGVLLATPAGGELFALKRVLCGSHDQVEEARREVAVMRRLRHPCLLPLLDAAVRELRTPDGASRTVVLMLFPLYDRGNLFEFVQQQRQQWQASAPARLAPAGAQQQHDQHSARHGVTRAALRAAHVREALQLFLQVCAALHSMHSMDPPLAHRDVKPHNVLLRLKPAGPANGSSSSSSSVQAGGGAAAAVAARGQQQQQQQQPPSSQQRRKQVELGTRGGGAVADAPGATPLHFASADGGQRWEATEWDAPGGDTALPSPTAPAAVVAVQDEQDGPQQSSSSGGQHPGKGGTSEPPPEWWERRLAAWREPYEAVLMDFGSTRTARIEVQNRAQAMAVQEDAERQCTAPYRAPELWDVPSSCTIDEKVDVWSLGCLLYFLLCGESPFERAVGEMGGSLMLAIVNGRYSWPDDAGSACPAAIKQLVAACLDPDAASRPTVAEVAVQADSILAALPVTF